MPRAHAMISRSMAAIAMSIFFCACSVGSFTGKVGGIGFTPKDAVYGYAHYTSSDPNIPGNLGIAIVALSSTVAACDDLAERVYRQSSEAVYFTLFSTRGNGEALPRGDFPLHYAEATDPSTIENFGYAYFDATDLNCQTQPVLWDAAHGTYSAAAVAEDGVIKVTDTGKNSLAASFNLTFGTGDRATGTFHATSCPTLKDLVDELAALEGFEADASAANAAATQPHTCKP